MSGMGFSSDWAWRVAADKRRRMRRDDGERGMFEVGRLRQAECLIWACAPSVVGGSGNKFVEVVSMSGNR